MTYKRFSYEKFKYGEKAVSLGTLSEKMIDFLCEKNPLFLTMLSSNTDILFWSDRMKHTELHMHDFFSDNEYYHCLENIPNIIHNPDYISLPPKGSSILFIKDFSAHVSVAVRVSAGGTLSYRTMYPITDTQLSDYIAKDRAWKWTNTNEP